MLLRAFVEALQWWQASVSPGGQGTWSFLQAALVQPCHVQRRKPGLWLGDWEAVRGPWGLQSVLLSPGQCTCPHTPIDPSDRGLIWLFLWVVFRAMRLLSKISLFVRSRN